MYAINHKMIKKFNFFLLAGLSLITGCKKHENVAKDGNSFKCTVHISYMYPTGVIFKGYDSADISSFELLTYAGGSNMSNLIARDTIRNISTLRFNDTLINSSENPFFFALKDGMDYKINLFKVGATHTITGTKGGGDEYSWYQDSPCPLGLLQYQPLQNIHVDDSLLYPVSGYNYNDNWMNDYFVAITKH